MKTILEILEEVAAMKVPLNTVIALGDGRLVIARALDPMFGTITDVELIGEAKMALPHGGVEITGSSTSDDAEGAGR